MEDLTERIDLYLNNGLSREEKVIFEEQLKTDASLKEEVRLQQKMAELLEADAWLKTKGRVADLNSQKKNSVRSVLSIAAIFIGLAVSGYFIMNHQYSDVSLYSEYATPYPDRITTMGEDSPQLAQAMEEYNQQSYHDAASIFGEMRLQGNVREELILYEVIALTESKQSAKAAKLLEKYSHLPKNLKEAFAWQRILVSLINEEGDKALGLVEEYIALDYQYQRQKAEALKDDLESVWR